MDNYFKFVKDHIFFVKLGATWTGVMPFEREISIMLDYNIPPIGSNRKACILIMTFMLLLVNNVVKKMVTRVTNTISLYKLSNVLLSFICFKLVNFIIYFHFSK